MAYTALNGSTRDTLIAAGMVSSVLVVLRLFFTGLARERSRRVRLVALIIAACVTPTAAMVSVPTVVSAQSTTPTVTVTSPLAGSCATTSTRNLQASFVGTGTVAYMSYFLNGAWEKQVNGPTGPWNWTGNYANGTYSMVAKATLTNGTVITSPPITWSRLTTCPTPPPTTTTTMRTLENSGPT